MQRAPETRKRSRRNGRQAGDLRRSGGAGDGNRTRTVSAGDRCPQGTPPSLTWAYVPRLTSADDAELNQHRNRRAGRSGRSQIRPRCQGPRCRRDGTDGRPPIPPVTVQLVRSSRPSVDPRGDVDRPAPRRNRTGLWRMFGLVCLDGPPPAVQPEQLILGERLLHLLDQRGDLGR